MIIVQMFCVYWEGMFVIPVSGAIRVMIPWRDSLSSSSLTWIRIIPDRSGSDLSGSSRQLRTLTDTTLQVPGLEIP